MTIDMAKQKERNSGMILYAQAMETKKNEF